MEKMKLIRTVFSNLSAPLTGTISETELEGCRDVGSEQSTRYDKSLQLAADSPRKIDPERNSEKGRPRND